MELTVKDVINVTKFDNLFINGICAVICESNMNIIVDDYYTRTNIYNQVNLFIKTK